MNRSYGQLSTPLPHVLTTAQLVELLRASGSKVCHTTLWQLSTTDHTWSRCVIRRTRRSTTWSRQRLEDAGILARSSSAPIASDPIAGPGFTFRIQGIAQ